MKTFKEICQMSQEKVKAYMHEYLKNNQYEVINEDGFLYAKGDVPVLVMAHMDTVHKLPCTMIVEVGDKISSPQGIGGDDRCGIFIIMNLIKELRCSVLLCEDEEKGMIGARKFTKTKWLNDIEANYIIEFDRRGSHDAVFYNCANEKFTEFVTKNTGYISAWGSFSDISTVAPAAGIAAVNLSCGYYNAHTTDEYVVYNEMMHTLDVAKKLIQTESEAFEYIEKKRTYSYGNYNYSNMTFDGYYDSLDRYLGSNNKNKKRNKFLEYMINDMEVELEVVWTDADGCECTDCVSGNTKAEAWVNFFIYNPEVSFSMVDDYTFS